MPDLTTDSTASPLPGWLDLGNGARLFHWLHRPASPPLELAVIIAGPIGPEYMHCHRAIKRLAQSLAAAGITCLRFDPVAYGNSSGSPFDARLTDLWRDTLPQLARRLREQGCFARIGLVALRSASLLAESLLAGDDPVDSLVYWYPYTQGTAFLRDMEVIDQLIDSTEADGGYINAGGYPLTEETVKALSTFRIADVGHRVRRALILRPGGFTAGPGRLQRQLAESGIKCDEIASAALPKMARQAELSELPVSDIAAIVGWLRDDVRPSTTTGIAAWRHDLDYVSDGFAESILRCQSPSPLFGILCRPHGMRDSHRPLVLLGNIGAGHHVGPNRLNVDLARALSGVGLSSLRFDLANLGDSTLGVGSDDNRPYPPGAVDDIDAMLDAVEARVDHRQYVIAGLCSGAYNGFHAQRRLLQREIVETILINPLTFYLEEGESIIEPGAAKSAIRQNYYRDQTRNWRTWLRLAGNPGKIVSISAFVIGRAVAKLRQWINPLALRSGLVKPPPLARDIEFILARQGRLTFVISARDPGYEMIMGEAGRVVRANLASGAICLERFAGTDHTFSTLASRRALIEFIVRHLDQRYPAGKPAGD